MQLVPLWACLCCRKERSGAGAWAAVKCSFLSSDWAEILLVAPRWWGQEVKSPRSSILLSVDGSITTWKERGCSEVVPSSKLLYSYLKWKTRQREAEDKFRFLLCSTFHQIVVYSRGNECMFLFMIYAWFIQSSVNNWLFLFSGSEKKIKINIFFKQNEKKLGNQIVKGKAQTPVSK